MFLFIQYLQPLDLFPFENYYLVREMEINTKKPLVRWIIGPVTRSGFQCLKSSIESFVKHYDVDVMVCFNCDRHQLSNVRNYDLFDQRVFAKNTSHEPKGVSWKLYPTRIALDRHEIIVDNDIVFEEKIEEIDNFLAGDHTLMLQGTTTAFGRFAKHISPGISINSGIYGMPPGFDLNKYFNFYIGNGWENNAQHKLSYTFDEQGLVALSLLDYQNYRIIPNTVITNCEKELIPGKAMHFIGLNRDELHYPYRLWKSKQRRMYL